MRVLLTGAGGFLGGEIAQRLAVRPGIELVASARSRPPRPGGIVLDLADRAAIIRCLTGVKPDAVIHAAGRTEGPPSALLADNAIATANLAAALAMAAPDAGLVLLGSAAQYGDPSTDHPWREDDVSLPQNPYGVSKLAAEACALSLARRNGLKVTALRLFNVVSATPYGSQVFASFLRRAAKALAAGSPLRVSMGPLGAVRDFVSVSDVVKVVEAVLGRSAWGETLNVCTGVGRPVRALIEAVVAQLAGEMLIEEAEGEGGVAWSVGDPRRCEACLGVRPSADLTDVIASAAAWVGEEAAAHARSRA